MKRSVPPSPEQAEGKEDQAKNNEELAKGPNVTNPLPKAFVVASTVGGYREIATNAAPLKYSTFQIKLYYVPVLRLSLVGAGR